MSWQGFDAEIEEEFPPPQTAFKMTEGFCGGL